MHRPCVSDMYGMHHRTFKVKEKDQNVSEKPLRLDDTNAGTKLQTRIVPFYGREQEEFGHTKVRTYMNRLAYFQDKDSASERITLVVVVDEDDASSAANAA